MIYSLILENIDTLFWVCTKIEREGPKGQSWNWPGYSNINHWTWPKILIKARDLKGLEIPMGSFCVGL